MQISIQIDITVDEVKKLLDEDLKESLKGVVRLSGHPHGMIPMPTPKPPEDPRKQGSRDRNEDNA